MAGEGGSDVSRAWLIRAGKSGERDDFVLDNDLAGGGFSDIPDVTSASTRDDVKEMIQFARPGDSKNRVANRAGQLWALRSRVSEGDLVVLPLKSTSQIALGVVTGGYSYRSDPDPARRHVVSVNWKQTDIPRTAVKQDLLYSLGAFMTVCEITRNDGARRLQELLRTGSDPGASSDDAQATEEAGDVSDATDALQSGFDVELYGRDRIRTFVTEEFDGHELASLVAEVLKAEGFKTREAPPGPDGGIDIFAGRGPLGLDSPRVIVQVKSSPSPVDVKVVRELNGVLSTQDADQALLVAWGGVNKNARQELRSQFFRVQVWNADDLLDAVLRNYDKLSDGMRADLPLKRVWTLIEE